MSSYSSLWTIFVVQHSHIDLGFTDRPEVTADYHRQFIDQALAFACSAKNRARLGLDQIPGTCTDYCCVQDGAAFLSLETGIVWTTLDALLVHIGDTRLWQNLTAPPAAQAQLAVNANPFTVVRTG